MTAMTDPLPPGQPRRQSIAVVGSGISGISAAWLLSQKHDVTVFEQDDRPGGHTNTVMVDDGKKPVPVDTGFIVYNLATYPNLCALFDHLDLETAASDMSFAVSADDGGFEYAGSDINGLFAQRSNLVRPRFWRMTRDLLRFYKEAPRDLAAGRLPDVMTLGTYLDTRGYSAAFVDHHLLPMAAAIWSSPAMDMRAYPVTSFLRFFVNHGLLQLTNRPQWRTVRHGSRRYLDRLIAGSASGQGLGLRLADAVTSIRRVNGGVMVTDSQGREHPFDAVVIATHADDALSLLADPSDQERHRLGAFRYQANRAVLHRDPRLMPKRRTAWSSWNYLTRRDGTDRNHVCVTYWMNKLQPLETERDYFVTLNPVIEPDPQRVERTFDYMHPMFDTAALEAQHHLWDLQGVRNTWFCGAYFGSGFHEDGLQSGLAVAEQLGDVRRPWSVDNESGRIPVRQARHPTAEAR